MPNKQVPISFKTAGSTASLAGTIRVIERLPSVAVKIKIVGTIRASTNRQLGAALSVLTKKQLAGTIRVLVSRQRATLGVVSIVHLAGTARATSARLIPKLFTLFYKAAPIRASALHGKRLTIVLAYKAGPIRSRQRLKGTLVLVVPAPVSGKIRVWERFLNAELTLIYPAAEMMLPLIRNIGRAPGQVQNQPIEECLPVTKDLAAATAYVDELATVATFGDDTTDSDICEGC